jgi:tetratricopeptide (TPR) repeat protein
VADDSTDTPEKLFYAGNAQYEKRDYAKAVESYLKILDRGVENARLYYNIGNGFFKMGKLGYAILSYEKSKRLDPGDSDLRSNLEYARSLVEGSVYYGGRRNFIVKLIGRPFRDLSLNKMTATAAFLYIVVVLMALANTYSPEFAKKTRLIFFVVSAVFLWSLAIFAVRYYHQEILKAGIVVQKSAECKYEPVDNSANYYKLNEGDKVLILSVRNGWREIKRADGKSAWVKKEAVEEI